MTIIPKGYESRLSLYDTQRAVERIKYIFLAKLCTALHLVRVTAPLVVDPRLAIEAIKVPKAPMFAPRSMSFEFCMNEDNKSVAGTLEMN